MKNDGLGNIPYDIRLQLAQSKIRDDLAKQTGSWSGDYDYGKSDKVQATNGHYSDSGKLPWHPTFSIESAYSSPEFKGGTWTEDHGPNTMYNPNPKVTYTPSEDMIKAGTTRGLIEYMQKNEPDVELRMPSSKSNAVIEFFKSITNGVDKVAPKREELNKSASMGIRG